MIDLYNFGEGARQAGLHPRHRGRLAALVLRHAGMPVSHDGVMTDADIERLHSWADLAHGFFRRSRHTELPAADCLECTADAHHELDIRPVAPGAALDWKAARRASRRLARELAQAQERAEAA